MPQRPQTHRAPGSPRARERARWALDAFRLTYGRAHHRKLRKVLLRREPFCRLCRRRGILKPATIRDHEVPLSQGGADDLANSQPLCKPCHDSKTAGELHSRR